VLEHILEVGTILRAWAAIWRYILAISVTDRGAHVPNGQAIFYGWVVADVHMPKVAFEEEA
jgi:hypothetical protein